MINSENSILALLVEKDAYKSKCEEYKNTLNDILSNFYSIGGPLNDNVLGFDTKQRKWLYNIADNIESVI